MSNAPEVGSVWRHNSGAEYRVIHLANFYSSDVRYPLTVVYEGLANGKVWSRPMDQWHRSMTLVSEATQPAAGEPVYQWHDETAWQECNSKREYLHAKDNGIRVRILWTAPPAAAHGDEAVRKDATESAIQRACKELPEGWSLQIELERGAGDVTLFNAWDIVVDFGQDFESSISEQVEAAIDAAMRAQGDGEAKA